MCFLGDQLQCAPLSEAAKFSTEGGSIAAAVSPGPLGTKAASGPHCLYCEMDHFLVDQKVNGLFAIGLTVNVAQNGTVSEVDVENAPSPEIKSRIERQARLWIFEPYTKDGQRVKLKLKTKVQVNVIRPR